MNDRDELIRKILERPESLTQSEINTLTSDKDIYGQYRAAAMLRMAATAGKPCRSAKNNLRRLIVAASFAGALIAGAAVMVLGPQLIRHTDASVPEATAPLTDSPTEANGEHGITAEDTIRRHDITFDNKTLSEILRYCTDTFGCTLKTSNRKAMETRLYFEIKGLKSLDDIIAELNTFEAFDITFANDTITVNNDTITVN